MIVDEKDNFLNKRRSPLALAESLNEYWSPRIISEVDDCYVKVARLKGSLVWHRHENEDEMFLVLKGSLIIEFEGSQVELTSGDLYVVPKGVLHNPVAHEDCLVMVFERKTTAHTGSTPVKETRPLSDQLRPL